MSAPPVAANRIYSAPLQKHLAISSAVEPSPALRRPPALPTTRRARPDSGAAPSWEAVSLPRELTIIDNNLQLAEQIRDIAVKNDAVAEELPKNATELRVLRRRVMERALVVPSDVPNGRHQAMAHPQSGGSIAPPMRDDLLEVRVAVDNGATWRRHPVQRPHHHHHHHHHRHDGEISADERHVEKAAQAVKRLLSAPRAHHSVAQSPTRFSSEVFAGHGDPRREAMQCAQRAREAAADIRAAVKTKRDALAVLAGEERPGQHVADLITRERTASAQRKHNELVKGLQPALALYAHHDTRTANESTTVGGATEQLAQWTAFVKAQARSAPGGTILDVVPPAAAAATRADDGDGARPTPSSTTTPALMDSTRSSSSGVLHAESAAPVRSGSQRDAGTVQRSLDSAAPPAASKRNVVVVRDIQDYAHRAAEMADAAVAKLNRSHWDGISHDDYEEIAWKESSSKLLDALCVIYGGEGNDDSPVESESEAPPSSSSSESSTPVGNVDTTMSPAGSDASLKSASLAQSRQRREEQQRAAEAKEQRRQKRQEHTRKMVTRKQSVFQSNLSEVKEIVTQTERTRMNLVEEDEIAAAALRDRQQQQLSSEWDESPSGVSWAPFGHDLDEAATRRAIARAARSGGGSRNAGGRPSSRDGGKTKVDKWNVLAGVIKGAEGFKEGARHKKALIRDNDERRRQAQQEAEARRLAREEKLQQLRDEAAKQHNPNGAILATYYRKLVQEEEEYLRRLECDSSVLGGSRFSFETTDSIDLDDEPNALVTELRQAAHRERMAELSGVTKRSDEAERSRSTARLELLLEDDEASAEYTNASYSSGLDVSQIGAARVGSLGHDAIGQTIKNSTSASSPTSVTAPPRGEICRQRIDRCDGAWLLLEVVPKGSPAHFSHDGPIISVAVLNQTARPITVVLDVRAGAEQASASSAHEDVCRFLGAGKYLVENVRPMAKVTALLLYPNMYSVRVRRLLTAHTITQQELVKLESILQTYDSATASNKPAAGPVSKVSTAQHSDSLSAFPTPLPSPHTTTGGGEPEGDGAATQRGARRVGGTQQQQQSGSSVTDSPGSAMTFGTAAAAAEAIAQGAAAMAQEARRMSSVGIAALGFGGAEGDAAKKRLTSQLAHADAVRSQMKKAQERQQRLSKLFPDGSGGGGGVDGAARGSAGADEFLQSILSPGGAGAAVLGSSAAGGGLGAAAGTSTPGRKPPSATDRMSASIRSTTQELPRGSAGPASPLAASKRPMLVPRRSLGGTTNLPASGTVTAVAGAGTTPVIQLTPPKPATAPTSTPLSSPPSAVVKDANPVPPLASQKATGGMAAPPKRGGADEPPSEPLFFSKSAAPIKSGQWRTAESTAAAGGAAGQQLESSMAESLPPPAVKAVVRTSPRVKVEKSVPKKSERKEENKNVPLQRPAPSGLKHKSDSAPTRRAPKGAGATRQDEKRDSALQSSELTDAAPTMEQSQFAAAGAKFMLSMNDAVDDNDGANSPSAADDSVVHAVAPRKSYVGPLHIKPRDTAASPTGAIAESVTPTSAAALAASHLANDPSSALRVADDKPHTAVLAVGGRRQSFLRSTSSSARATPCDTPLATPAANRSRVSIVEPENSAMSSRRPSLALDAAGDAPLDEDDTDHAAPEGRRATAVPPSELPVAPPILVRKETIGGRRVRLAAEAAERARRQEQERLASQQNSKNRPLGAEMAGLEPALLAQNSSTDSVSRTNRSSNRVNNAARNGVKSDLSFDSSSPARLGSMRLARRTSQTHSDSANTIGSVNSESLTPARVGGRHRSVSLVDHDNDDDGRDHTRRGSISGFVDFATEDGRNDAATVDPSSAGDSSGRATSTTTTTETERTPTSRRHADRAVSPATSPRKVAPSGGITLLFSPERGGRATRGGRLAGAPSPTSRGTGETTPSTTPTQPSIAVTALNDNGSSDVTPSDKPVLSEPAPVDSSHASNQARRRRHESLKPLQPSRRPPAPNRFKAMMEARLAQGAATPAGGTAPPVVPTAAVQDLLKRVEGDLTNDGPESEHVGAELVGMQGETNPAEMDPVAVDAATSAGAETVAATEHDAPPEVFSRDPAAYVDEIAHMLGEVAADVERHEDDPRAKTLSSQYSELTDRLLDVLARISQEARDKGKQDAHSSDPQPLRQALLLHAWNIQQRRVINLKKMLDLLDQKTGRRGGWHRSYTNDNVYDDSDEGGTWWLDGRRSVVSDDSDLRSMTSTDRSRLLNGGSGRPQGSAVFEARLACHALAHVAAIGKQAVAESAPSFVVANAAPFSKRSGMAIAPQPPTSKPPHSSRDVHRALRHGGLHL